MSIARSCVIRCLCVSLAGSFFLLVCAWQCRAWEALFPAKVPFPFTWDEEISEAIVLTWAVLVAIGMLRKWFVPLAGSYGAPLRSTAIQHAIVFGLAALMLDGGLSLLSCFLAAALFWMIVGIIISRRPSLPSGFDLAVISHGFWSLSFLVTCMAYCAQGLV